MKKRFLVHYIFVFITIFFISNSFLTPYIYASSSYIWNDNYVETSSSPEVDLSLNSESAILIEQNTGQILFEKNCHEQLRPASVTKIMTILLIMEALDTGKITLNDKVPCSENASKMGGSQIWLDTREELTVHEMLKAICVASANDCTVAMAEFLEGSTQNFVTRMNEKAKMLNMNDTCFKNCHGLDEDGHITSSYDIAIMSRELLNKHPSITNYSTIYMDSLRDGKSELVNTNKLIKNYKGATGLKTGSTGLALYNLSASATRDNLSLIAVIMKAPNTKTRFNEASMLLDYGFNSYTYKNLNSQNEIYQNLPVSKGIPTNVNILYKDSCGIICKKGEKENFEQSVIIYNNLSAPLYQNEEIGEIQYLIDGKIITSTKLIVDKDVKKLSFFNMYDNIVAKWFTLLKT